MSLNQVLDNRGCSGGTGVDIVAFGMSDFSQNDLAPENIGLASGNPTDNSLVTVKASGNGPDVSTTTRAAVPLSRSVSPFASGVKDERI